MRSYPGFCRSKQLEYNPGLTHRCRAGHPRANRRTSDRPSFCGVRPSCSRVIMSCHIFQSTHPLRGATREDALFAIRKAISIHAPLAGCDFRKARFRPRGEYFNPRTPCGVRHETVRIIISARLFQSTHPLRGATTLRSCEAIKILISIHAPLAGCDRIFQIPYSFSLISIHAPLAGCDVICDANATTVDNFNPRTPCGVRLDALVSSKTADVISIHAPLAGCDSGLLTGGKIGKNFNPRTPCGVRLWGLFFMVA